MRRILITMSMLSVLLLSACQNAVDLERQKNLVEQTNRPYAVTENKPTEVEPRIYEFCGSERYPCPDLTQIKLDQQEKQTHENP